MYKAAVDLIERNLPARGDHVALRQGGREVTYRQLSLSVNRAANALQQLGVELEQRVLLLMLDTPALPALFWGAIKLGAVPVPANTMLTSSDYDHMLRDSRARVLVVSPALYEKIEPVLEDQPFLRHVIRADDPVWTSSPDRFEPAPTSRDDVAFWLYSSGSTGKPKGAIHLQGDLDATARLYGQGVLGIRADDVVFSAAKLFFAYGLGNGMTFPFSAGATAILLEGRPTPQAVMQVLRDEKPTIFFGVPTLYASILADPANTRVPGLRLCVSAGEALPREIGERWKDRFGVDILDGIGSTEMLHIFLSLQPGDIKYGTTGKPVPGYDCQIVDEQERPVRQGDIGDLRVRGPSSAIGYWNNREKSVAAFRGPWTYTGDKYYQDQEGYFVCCGRSDDMIKAGGIWVSPAEVEACLVEHPAVLEAAVVGHEDENGLTKPKAFVVRKRDCSEAELQAHVKSRLAPYKYPRWIEFVDALPKTATGKIQRFRLRVAR